MILSYSPCRFLRLISLPVRVTLMTFFSRLGENNFLGGFRGNVVAESRGLIRVRLRIKFFHEKFQAKFYSKSSKIL